MIEGSHPELVGPLRDGEIDLLVGALRPQMPDGIAQRPLFEDRPLIFARTGHPLAAMGGSFGPEDLLRYPWIVPAQGTPLRTQWGVMFEAAGVPAPRVAIECGSALMVRQMLIDSDFLTLLSTDQLAVEVAAGLLTAVGDAPGDISRTIGITTREDWRPTALQSRFVDMLRTSTQTAEYRKS